MFLSKKFITNIDKNKKDHYTPKNIISKEMKHHNSM